MDFKEFRFAFYARDFQASIDFYKGILGCEMAGGWDRDSGKGALIALGGNVVIEIYGAAEGTVYDGPSPSALNLAIQLEDSVAVDSFYTRLRELNADIPEPPEDRFWGHRSFVVTDPDGIPIHLYCEIIPR